VSSSTRSGKTSSNRLRAAILASAEAIRSLSVKGSWEDMAALHLSEELGEERVCCSGREECKNRDVKKRFG
jgi:hypothetical protein